MTFTSYRRERVGDINRALEKRNDRAGKFVATEAKRACPVETRALRTSIHSDVHGSQGVDIGFGGVHYGRFVHNGTYDFNHRMGEWSEAEAMEILAWQSAQMRRGGSTEIIPPKGLMPRPFLVYGLVTAKPGLRAIYGEKEH